MYRGFFFGILSWLKRSVFMHARTVNFGSPCPESPEERSATLRDFLKANEKKWLEYVGRCIVFSIEGTDNDGSVCPQSVAAKITGVTLMEGALPRLFIMPVPLRGRGAYTRMIRELEIDANGDVNINLKSTGSLSMTVHGKLVAIYF
jgi:hypothetical protein